MEGTLLKLNVALESYQNPIGKDRHRIVFQPPFFQGRAVKLRGGVHYLKLTYDVDGEKSGGHQLRLGDSMSSIFLGTPNLLSQTTKNKLKNNKHVTPRWFKVPFSSPSWRSLNPLKGSLNHPEKVTLNHQDCNHHMILLFSISRFLFYFSRSRLFWLPDVAGLGQVVGLGGVKGSLLKDRGFESDHKGIQWVGPVCGSKTFES